MRIIVQIRTINVLLVARSNLHARNGNRSANKKYQEGENRAQSEHSFCLPQVAFISATQEGSPQPNTASHTTLALGNDEKVADKDSRVSEAVLTPLETHRRTRRKITAANNRELTTDN